MAVIRSANNAKDFALIMAESDKKEKRLLELERENRELKEVNAQLLKRLQHSEHERFIVGGYTL